MKLRMIALAAVSLTTLGACVDDGYGYGYGGVSYGYGGPSYYGSYYNDFYDGGYGTPYYGWYGGYYYPGSGYYVYDRYRRPYRWNSYQQRYWQDRGRYYRGPSRPNEWRGFDRGPQAQGGDGYRWRGNGNNGGNNNRGNNGRWRNR